MEAFIAPANFDANAQPLNIVTVFGDYANANKAYIFSFTSAIATLTLPAATGITYRWGETISGVDYVHDVVSGTAFTAGSTKRYVIVNSTATSIVANISSGVGINGAVWLYCSSKVYGIYAGGSSYLKYVHYEDLNSVTTIGTLAFYRCSGLTGTLTIPDTVTSIGQNAFDGCTGFTGTLTIPNTVTTINGYTFYGCTGFAGLTLSNSLTTLGGSNFYGCTGMSGTLTIPASIRTIAETTFTNCGFNHIENYSNEFLVEDEVLYTATTITALHSAKVYSGTLTLKTNTTRIGDGCFLNNLRTGTLTIPSTVTTIGASAFSYCTGLTGTLTIPNSVTTISVYAFAGCTGLTGSLTISNSVTSIGNYAFQSCTGLTGTLTISNSVTSIGNYAFYDIPFTHLISNSSYFEVYDEVLYTTTGTITAIYSAKGYAGTLTLKSNVVIIVDYCFYNNNLRTGTLTIPNTVTTIGNNAFSSCTNLTGTLTIPNSVTTIGSSAFAYCNKLNGIATIGSGITKIGTAAFYYISTITEWRILSSVAPSVQSQTWGNFAKPLHVKIGATGYNVAPWTNTAIFSSIIYDL